MTDKHHNDFDAAFDRRGEERHKDPAGWVRTALNKQNAELAAIRTDVVVEIQSVENTVKSVESKINQVESKVDYLHKTLIQSVPGGDPEAHLRDHLQIAVERKEREEAEAEAKAFRKDLMKKLKMAIVMGAVGLFTLGAFEQFRTLVLGAVSGKSAQELRDGK